jgi:hypothetical protein
MATSEEMTREYVAEYLSQRPDYSDLVEYIDYEFDVDDQDEDGFFGHIWEEVQGLLDTVEQRFLDEDS